MALWPLNFEVSVRGVGRPARAVRVFAYNVTRSEETRLAGHLRLVEVLQVIAPPGVIDRGDTITIDNGTEWEVDANPEDHENNPYFTPGLVIYYGNRIE